MAEQVAGERVRQRMGSLSPAERKLARVLLASYPIAGLESLVRFAERAGVSPPTVTRFVAKLGFHGYPEFQDALRREVQARLSSPLARYRPAPPPGGSGAFLFDALAAFQDSLGATAGLVSGQDFDDAGALLAACPGRVLVLGGRVTAGLAGYLAGQLHLLRPGTALVDPARDTPAQRLVDVTRRDTLVAFDVRRYQPDTIEGVRVAAARGATVVLFTDPWLSPAAAVARHVLVTAVDTVAPFDSLVGATAIVEALIAAIIHHLGSTAEARLRRLESLRDGGRS